MARKAPTTADDAVQKAVVIPKIKSFEEARNAVKTALQGDDGQDRALAALETETRNGVLLAALNVSGFRFQPQTEREATGAALRDFSDTLVEARSTEPRRRRSERGRL